LSRTYVENEGRKCLNCSYRERLAALHVQKNLASIFPIPLLVLLGISTDESIELIVLHCAIVYPKVQNVQPNATI
jgi:hypothetical protein